MVSSARLYTQIVDDFIFVSGKIGPLSCRDSFDNLLFHARFPGQFRVGVVLELCPPMPPGDEDRDLRESLGRGGLGGLGAQEFVEGTRSPRQFRALQPRRERADDLRVRPGCNQVENRPLFFAQGFGCYIRPSAHVRTPYDSKGYATSARIFLRGAFQLGRSLRFFLTVIRSSPLHPHPPATLRQ